MDTAPTPETPASARSTRPRRRRAVLAGAGVLVVAAAVAVPWTISQRSAAREAAVSAAVEACRADQASGDPADDPVGPMRVIASEVRGDAVLTFAAADASPDRAALCQHAVGNEAEGSSVGFSDELPREVPPAGTVSMLGVGGGGASSWAGAWGYAADDVATLTVTTETGDEVEATVTDGYWVAWWEADAGAELTGGTARTHDGRTTAVDLRI